MVCQSLSGSLKEVSALTPNTSSPPPQSRFSTFLNPIYPIRDNCRQRRACYCTCLSVGLWTKHRAVLACQGEFENARCCMKADADLATAPRAPGTDRIIPSQCRGSNAAECHLPFVKEGRRIRTRSQLSRRRQLVHAVISGGHLFTISIRGGPGGSAFCFCRGSDPAVIGSQ